MGFAAQADSFEQLDAALERVSQWVNQALDQVAAQHVIFKAQLQAELVALKQQFLVQQETPAALVPAAEGPLELRPAPTCEGDVACRPQGPDIRLPDEALLRSITPLQTPSMEKHERLSGGGIWSSGHSPQAQSLGPSEQLSVELPASPLPSPRKSTTTLTLLTVVSAGSEETVRQHLQLRLGLLSKKEMINGQDLHDAVSSLGLTRYSVQEMSCLVNRIAFAINLRFSDTEKAGKRRRLQRLKNDSTLEKAPVPYGTPIWEWPKPLASPFSRLSTNSVSKGDYGSDHTNAVIPLKALMQAFTAPDVRKIFGQGIEVQINAIKEVLMSGETNRLVSELTCVRIDDLAAPPPESSKIVFLEPVVAFVILANGILVGVQTDASVEDWRGWIVVEVLFTSFFFHRSVHADVHQRHSRVPWWSRTYLELLRRGSCSDRSGRLLVDALQC